MGEASTTPARDARVGSELEGYRLGEPLGSGGMGTVYRATDLGTGKDVALKLLRADLADSEERRRRLLREARVAATLSHPGIVRVLEVGDKGGTIFLAMELVGGRTLRALLKEEPPSVDEALRLAGQIATALVHAHEKGIVHRDLKPDNVMVCEDGSVRVLDFGLAKLREVDGGALYQAETESNLTREGGVLGTPGYMAPEQAMGKEVSFAADVFAFGALLYELLTGAKAFTGESPMDTIVAVTRDTPARPREKNPAVNETLDDLVMRCLEKAPEDRPSMESVMRTLATPAVRAKRKGRRAWLLLVAVVVVSVPLAMLLHRAPPKLVTPTTIASEAPSVVPTALTDLPPPASSVPAALAAFAKAMRAERDGMDDAAVGELQTAVKLDPELAAAQLRLAERLSLYEAASGREHYALARKHRDRLSPRDAELLDACEPLLQRDPSDMVEWRNRLTALSAKYPGDAELAFESAAADGAVGEFEASATQARRASNLDPHYGVALSALAQAEAYHGDLAKAHEDVAKCLVAAPSGTQCLWLDEFVEDRIGDCPATEANARQRIAVDPSLPDGYKSLAFALAAIGSPIPAVRTAVDQAVARMQGDEGKLWGMRMYVRLAILDGDFATASKLGEQLEKLTGPLPNISPHATFADLVGSAERESGHPERAAAIARSFLDQQGAWQTETIVHDWTMALDLTPTILTLVHGTKGFPEASYDAALAAWRKRYVARTHGGYRPYVWVYGYAEAVVTAEDARRAVEALPEYEPLPPFIPDGALPEAAVGRTLWLAGREEEGTRWLRAGTKSCNIGTRPLEWIRAHAWLAEALEKSGDTKGACEALGVVLTHWGNAKPRSITADWSKARAQALRCERP